MGMIDFHSHILPGVDDGSKTVEESIKLLEMLSEQGVDTVVATPHFNADRMSVETFKRRRNTAHLTLKNELHDVAPKILLGAEVKYYEGISHMPGLASLCTEGTKLLLLEMPIARWTEYTLGELIHLSRSGDITVILAHVERYLFLQSSDACNRLLENDILLQANADLFTDRISRRKAFSMLKNGLIHVLGSDCHGISHRPPYIGKAVALIEKKMGKSFVNNMIDYGCRLLSKSV